jgi:hypothetical protein
VLIRGIDAAGFRFDRLVRDCRVGVQFLEAAQFCGGFRLTPKVAKVPRRVGSAVVVFVDTHDGPQGPPKPNAFHGIHDRQ